MRLLLIIFSIFQFTILNAQSNLIFGHYATTFAEIGFFNEHIELNSNMTYQYESMGDMNYEYLSGEYKISNDTLELIIDSNQVNEYWTFVDSITGKIDTISLGDRNEKYRITKYLITKKGLISLSPQTLEIHKVYNYKDFKKALRKEGVKKKRIRKFELIKPPFVRWRNSTGTQ